jgi:riboflavin kinase / FMN adenylyltransferase
MQVSHGLEGLASAGPGAVLTIGNFDGVHLGHQRILSLAHALRADASGREIVVATFEPHPLTVLRPEAAPPRLTPPDVKRELLAAAGVDRLVILPPTKDILNLTAAEFWELLRHRMRPSHIIEGHDFSFGKGRAGSIANLMEWSIGTGITVHEGSPREAALLDMQIVPVSSSLIRWLLSNGRARDAAICLGRPFAIHGAVIAGFQRGRTIGVPTANLKPDGQMLPADGVYAGRCAREGQTYAAAVSVGTMPTFNGAARQVEAHLIGFSGDLYGQDLRVELLDWLRDQQKFPGVTELKSQLARDIAAAASRINMDPAIPLATVA